MYNVYININKHAKFDFNLPFQIVIYHPILSNKCNNIFPPVLSSCIVTLLELFLQRSNHILHSLYHASSIKNRLISE